MQPPTAKGSEGLQSTDLTEAVPTIFARVIGLIDRDRRRHWIGLVALALVASVFEALGALLILMILNLIISPATALELPLIGDVSSYLPEVSRRQLFLGVAGFTAVFFVIRGLLLVLQSYVQNRVAWSTGVRLSERLNRVYLASPYSFHLRRNSSELIRNSFESVNVVVENILIPAVLMGSEALVAFTLLVVLIVVAPLATLLALLSFGVLIFVVTKGVQPRLEHFGNLSQSAAAETIRSLQQGLHGIREIRVLGRESYFQDEFLRHRRDTATSRAARNVLVDIPRISLESAIVLVLVGLLALTVAGGEPAAETLSVLGLFAYAVLRMMPPVNRVLTAANHIKFGIGALDIVSRELAELETSVVPSTEVWTREEVVPRLPLRNCIVLDAASFRYYPDGPDVVNDVSLRIEKGQSIGFVGPTGGGKTTLIDLILGLLIPTDGTIQVDGTDIRTCTRAWQASLGVVHQNVFLLDDSLRRNIALGMNDEEIDDRAIDDAVELAHLDQLIGDLPEGLDTVVGERGMRLSGGQRQRVAIARALYHRPSVLVFDEGTSALDNVTEAAIIDALARLRGDHTILTVAHRLSTVRACDWIAVIEAGQVTATGSFEELLERSPSFRQMVR